MLLLLVLVGQMDTWLRASEVIVQAAQSEVALPVEYKVRSGSNDQQIHTNIEFSSFQQKRSSDVSGWRAKGQGNGW